MRTAQKVIHVLLCLTVLSGCQILLGTPTPLPLAHTATPLATTPQPTPQPPTPTFVPLPTFTPQPAVAVVSQVIALDDPPSGATVGNPVTVRGRTAMLPFEATLVVRVYDAWGQLAAVAPIMAQGEYGGPATFEGVIYYGGVPGVGRIEVADVSAKDGKDIAAASVAVTLSGFPGSGYIEMPAPLEQVTVPARVLARVGQPGEQVNVTLTWNDGTQFAHVVTLLPGKDGRGLAVIPMDWVVTPRPAHPNTQGGALQIHNLAGQPLAWQPLTILHPNDAATMSTNVYWVRQEQVVAQSIRIPRTQGIGRASLEALLWGPVPNNLDGFQTALPLPAEVLTAANRGADWGERVRLKDLTIVNGVAKADFSKELLANAGGAARMSLIRQQIEQTLLQFSTVTQVIISVEGQTGMLEP
ncbi:MAG TPA: Gmad2 immunoglobulin-like domain-containing protein [Anaerolineae bacterium]|nr:Gmad2 immunoglobulin-like domain-containing protein [Anaerolineae bacterium]HQI84625.1 Gmad2 immunoglobulin-like domain-containing protein [Anaerolineae bacterium]